MAMTAYVRRPVRPLLACLALVLMAGCGHADTPLKFTTIADANAFSGTRSDVKSGFDAAAASATDAVEGGGIRNGDRVRDVTCGEAYGKEFRELEIGGSFVTSGVDLEDVVSRVRQAWDEQGWSVELTDPDRIMVTTETSTGVRVTGWATVQAAAGDPSLVAVSLKVGTGCLKLPKSVADNL